MGSENTNMILTAEAWAEITIANWLLKIDKLGISYSFQLADSFAHHIIANAGGVVERIEFAFNYYGKFVDMGVGKGVKIADVKSLSGDRYLSGKGAGNVRHPKKWYQKTFYAELMKLKDILAEKYAHKGQLAIVNNLDDNAERWREEFI